MTVIELRSQQANGSDAKSEVQVSTVEGPRDGATQDAIALARSGKQQVLTRRFGLVSMTGFSCGLMCTWEGMLVAFLLGFQNGGPAGLIYGFFLVWIGTIATFIVMGEMASMVPTAGGQYHWVSLMAPPSIRRFLSYVTGWITVVGWVAGFAAGAFFVSSLIQALMVLNNPDYDPTGWQGTLIFWAVILVCALINTVLGKVLPAIEIGILILHTVGFFAIIVPLLYLAPKTTGQEVFTTFQNLGGWSSIVLSFFVGLNGNAVAFVGTDGAIHMSEEVKNSTTNVPRAMILSTMINGVLAFGMLVTVLFCAGNINEAVTNAPNGYPFIAIFAEGTGSIGGATAMTVIIVLLELGSSIGALAAASRMVWSFARDRGVPGNRLLSKVERRTTIPLAAVVAVCVFSGAIGLINVGSSTAFNDVISLVLEGFYTSYLIACGLLLYHRIRGNIRDPYQPGEAKEGELEWGPWRVRGILGIIINIIACLFLILIAFFSYWPAVIPVTAVNMNYSALVLGVVAIGSMIYYFARARRIYNGPIVEIRVQ